MDFTAVKTGAIVALVVAYVWAMVGIYCQSSGLVVVSAILAAIGAFFGILSLVCED